MMNHVFHLYETGKRFKDAYEVAVNIGFLEEAVRLASNHGLPPSITQPILAKIFDYVQAKHLLTIIPHPDNSKKHQPTHKNLPRRPVNGAILPPDRGNKSLIASLDRYTQRGEKPNRSSLKDGALRGFFDLLVRDYAPKATAINLTKNR